MKSNKKSNFNKYDRPKNLFQGVGSNNIDERKSSTAPVILINDEPYKLDDNMMQDPQSDENDRMRKEAADIRQRM